MIKVLQIKLNNCEAAHDILEQTIRTTKAYMWFSFATHTRPPGRTTGFITRRSCEIPVIIREMFSVQEEGIMLRSL